MNIITTIEQAAIWFQHALSAGLAIMTGRKTTLVSQRVPVYRASQRGR